MKKVIITFLFLLLPFCLLADNTAGTGSDCTTSLDDEGGQAYITFLGDSLGDLFDHIGYGWTGWNGYLAFHRSDIPWRTQNLAVVGKRTHHIFDYLKLCTNRDNRSKFITQI